MADAAGGGIMAWLDSRNGTLDIYVQRVDALGVPQWTTDGVFIGSDTHGVFPAPAMIPDGAGGAIICWENASNNIYAQHVDAAGVVQWSPGGVPLCVEATEQFSPTVTSDGAGGAIATWQDLRNGNRDVYAQRVDASGVVQWAVNGVAICTHASWQADIQITTDGSGGAILVWEDFRNGPRNLYGQRVDAAGSPQWTANGVAVCTESSSQSSIASDGAGGAIVTWGDYRNVTFAIYAQRLNSSGSAQWTPNGLLLAASIGAQSFPNIAPIAPDGSGGAVVIWNQRVTASNMDVYAQRVNAAGSVEWTPNGVGVCANTSHQLNPTVAADGAGGAIVTWMDYRNGNAPDVFAQRVDVSGANQWTSDGLALSTAVNSQAMPRVASDGFGGAIVIWADNRNANDDVYALRVASNGQLPTGVHDTPSLSGVVVSANYPNPFSAGTAIDVTLQRESNVSVEIFDVAGRRVRGIDVGRLPVGASRVVFDGRDDSGSVLPSGMYFSRVKALGETHSRKIMIAR